MSAILYDLLTDADFRNLVVQEHEMLTDGLDRYLNNLEEKYQEEMNIEVEEG